MLADPDLTLFRQAVEDADLVDLFEGTMSLVDLSTELGVDLQLDLGIDPALDTFTVFAPVNTAIEDVPDWNGISQHPDALRRFVLAHIVPDSYLATDLFAETELTALSEDVLTIDSVQQTINGAHLVTTDLPAPNGVLHTVDALLVVPTPTSPAIVPTTPPATVPETAPATVAPATVPPATPPPATLGG